MRLLTRDLTTIHYLNKFQMLMSSHIQSFVFPDTSSTNPMYRSLNRLLADDYIAKLERRLIGGPHGGGSQYVYQLGLEGHHFTGRTDRYRPARIVRPHTLAIADVYRTMLELERAGLLRIVSYDCEPDCHQTIGQFELKPDMRVELLRPQTGSHIRLMLEVDLGSERQAQLTSKLVRYWNAHQAATTDVWADDLLVLWIVPDERRAQELRTLISRGTPEQQMLFRVQLMDNLAAALSG